MTEFELCTRRNITEQQVKEFEFCVSKLESAKCQRLYCTLFCTVLFSSADKAEYMLSAICYRNHRAQWANSCDM